MARTGRSVTPRVLAVAIFVASGVAHGQIPNRQFEGRVEGVVDRAGALLAGGGVAWPVGPYSRLAVTTAFGARLGSPGGGVARIDLMGRFHVDPFREYRRAPYAAAGVSAWVGTDERARQTLALVVGLEGAMHRGRVWALEMGVGGGVRVAVVRRSVTFRTRSR